MTGYETLTLCVSVIAVVIAAVSLVRTRTVQRKQLELQALAAALARKQLTLLQQDEETKNKANITVELVEAGRTDFRFVLSNQGKAAATKVNLGVAKNSSDNPLLADECERKLPYPRLEPGQSFTLIAALHMGSAMSYAIHLNWENPDGSKESRDVDVSL